MAPHPKRPDIGQARSDFLKDRLDVNRIMLDKYFTMPQVAFAEYEKPRVSSTSLKHLTRTSISNLDFGRPTKGKYLLLRTLEPADVVVGVLHSFVEDHTGDGTRFCAYHMMVNLTDDCQEIFPIGIIFILKEPYLKISKSGHFMLRCDSPSDILMLHEGHKYFYLTEGIEWKNKLSTTPYPDSEYHTQKTAHEWKVLANEMYKRKKFIHATRFYYKGLSEAEKSKDTDLCKVLHLNLSAAYLSSGWYESAIKTAKKALEIDPQCLKAHFRAGRANYELRKYAESQQWFSQFLQNVPDYKEAKKELQRCEHRLTEATQGNHSIYQMVLERTVRPRQPIDCADYIGPIRVVNIPGKGRGYVATKDVAAGTLLLVSKALYVAWDVSSTREQFSEYDTGSVDIYDLVSAIVSIVMKNPNTFGASIYNLCGRESKSEEQSDPSQVFCDPKIREEPIVDVHSICNIVRNNSHRAHSGSFDFLTDDSPTTGTSKNSGSGLFVSASLFNHHCISNAFYEVYNDVMFVRAVQPIKEGEEISIRYFFSEMSYNERKQRCTHYGFLCDCRLCLLDEKEPSTFLLLRQYLLETFENEILPKTLYQPVYENIFQDVSKLITDIKSTYKKSKRSELKLDLVTIYRFLGNRYKWLGLQGLAADCYLNVIRAWGFEPDELLATFEKTKSVTFNCSKYPSSSLMVYLEMLIHSYLRSGKLSIGKKWIRIMFAFEQLLSGGDAKVFKLKYTTLASFCDGLSES